MDQLTAEAERLAAAFDDIPIFKPSLEIPIKERIHEIAIEMGATAGSAEELDAQLRQVFGDENVFTQTTSDGALSFMLNMNGEMVALGNSTQIFTDAESKRLELHQQGIDVIRANAEAMSSFSGELEYLNNMQAEMDRAEYVAGLSGFSNELERLNNLTPETASGLDEIAGTAAKVAKVLDGDTLRLDSGVDVRLNAINTPETAKEFLGKVGMPFGDEATEFTQEFLLNPEITIDERGTDDYDRMLAGVFNSDGDSLEHALVEAGLALPLPVHMTGDEELTAELEQLARDAAEAGRGVFENEDVADAFLSGRISDMEEVAFMYEELAAAEQAYYDQYIGYLNTTVSSLDQMQSKLAEAAVNKALLEGDIDKVPMILDMAVNMGVMTEEQATLQEQFASSMMLIDEYAVAMGDADFVSVDMTETMMLLSTGLFESSTQAEFLAEKFGGDVVQGILDAAAEGQDLRSILDELGIAIDNLDREITVQIRTDTSGFVLPETGAVVKGNESGGAVAFSAGGRVTGGVQGQDSVAAVLMPDEYVIRADVARSLGYDALDALNTGQVPQFAQASPAPTSGAAAPVSGGQYVINNYFTVQGGADPQEIADAAGASMADVLRQIGVNAK